MSHVRANERDTTYFQLVKRIPFSVVWRVAAHRIDDVVLYRDINRLTNL